MPTSNLDGSEARAREEFKADFGITFEEFDELERYPEALLCLSRFRRLDAIAKAGQSGAPRDPHASSTRRKPNNSPIIANVREPSRDSRRN
jgi:hypothetical protein